MGTASSVPAEREREVSHVQPRPTTVRERLRHEFGHSVEDEQEGQQQENGLKLSEMPGVFKAKAMFLRPLKKSGGKDTNIQKKPDNHALLKELYRRMDPSITAGQITKITGELQLSVKYKHEGSNLLVKVGQAKNLKMENAHKLPDPYVCLELLTSRTTEGSPPECRMTKQKWNTGKPVFQEILVFFLPASYVAEARIKATVKSKDKISEDDFLGEVIIPLCKLNLSNGLPQWYQLHPETDLTITGSIQLSTKYALPNKLSVTVHEGYGLKAANQAANTSSPYVRCLITGIEGNHQTDVAAETLNPVFEKTFEFTIYKEEFEHRVLVVNLFSNESVGKDKRLGDVHVPLADLDEGTMPKTWFDLSDMRSAPDARKQWSQEAVVSEFREAMRAHIVYQFPKFLYGNNHKGKKFISVSSSKARSSAKLTVIDGFPEQQQ